MTISDTPNVTIGANGMSANGTTESAQVKADSKPAYALLLCFGVDRRQCADVT